MRNAPATRIMRPPSSPSSIVARIVSSELAAVIPYTILRSVAENVLLV